MVIYIGPSVYLLDVTYAFKILVSKQLLEKLTVAYIDGPTLTKPKVSCGEIIDLHMMMSIVSWLQINGLTTVDIKKLQAQSVRYFCCYRILIFIITKERVPRNLTASTRS